MEFLADLGFKNYIGYVPIWSHDQNVIFTHESGQNFQTLHPNFKRSWTFLDLELICEALGIKE